MIQPHEVLPLLVQAYPNFRSRLVTTAEQWLGEDGSISLYAVLFQLTYYVVERFARGDYDDADRLFALVEVLLADGNHEVGDAIATGFLENLQNQTQLDGRFWTPLLGPKAREFCYAMDRFWGADTAGLDE